MQFVHNIIATFNKDHNERIYPINHEKRADYEAIYLRKIEEVKRVLNSFKSELWKYEYPVAYTTEQKNKTHILSVSMTAKTDTVEPYNTILEIISNANTQAISILVKTRESQTNQTLHRTISDLRNNNSYTLEQFDADLIKTWLEKLLGIALLVK